MMSDKLKMWYIEAYKELSIPILRRNIDQQSYAIYPKRFYKNINLNFTKKYDLIFIGGFSTDPRTKYNRKWIISFINNNFNSNSYLQFTDAKTKIKL